MLAGLYTSSRIAFLAFETPKVESTHVVDDGEGNECVSRCSANPSAAAALIAFARMSRDQYDEPVGRPVVSGLISGSDMSSVECIGRVYVGCVQFVAQDPVRLLELGAPERYDVSK